MIGTLKQLEAGRKADGMLAMECCNVPPFSPEVGAAVRFRGRSSQRFLHCQPEQGIRSALLEFAIPKGLSLIVESIVSGSPQSSSQRGFFVFFFLFLLRSSNRYLRDAHS